MRRKRKSEHIVQITGTTQEPLLVTESAAGRDAAPRHRRIAVVGFGYIGCVIGAALAERGYSVTGIEPERTIREAIAAGRTPFNEPGLAELIAATTGQQRIAVTEDYAEAAEADVILITVGTPLNESGDADLDQIQTASRLLAPHVRDDQLVILKSTVPPGTTEEVLAPPLAAQARVHVAFCPERLAEGQALADLSSVPVIVGGIDEESTRVAGKFWREALDVEIIEMQNSRSAEMVKLASNLWIDLNIALGNELAKICDSLGDVDVLSVIDAANTLPKLNHNVNILVPSVGVGGACLTKDPWFVHGFARKMGLELQTPRTSREVNDSMPAYTVSLIDRFFAESGRTPGDCRIAVLGLAFKNHTGDCRYTPVRPAIEVLRRRGYRIAVHDPWVTDSEAREVSGVQPAPDIETAVEGADCIAFFAGHREFRSFPPERLAALANPGALVVDGRIFFDREKIRRLRELGLHYKGVGR